MLLILMSIFSLDNLRAGIPKRFRGSPGPVLGAAAPSKAFACLH